MTPETAPDGFLSKNPDLKPYVEKIPFPKRTEKSPSGVTDRIWVNGFTSNWTHFRDTAIDWLATRGPAEIDLLLFDNKSLNEEFRLSKPAIRKNVLRIRKMEDLRDVYRFFSLGREVGKNEIGETILSITRKELLQLCIAAYSRKYLLLQRRNQLASNTASNLSSESSWGVNPAAAVDENEFFAHVDKIMRMKPERGGPLFSK